MKFEGKIRNFIETECEDYFLGMVDLTLVESSAIQQYESLLTEYPRAISIGVTLPPTISDELSEIEDADGKNTVYNRVQCQLKSITSNLSSLLEHEGYQALSMPTAKGIIGMTYISFHEIVANLANMGKIEKNHLITPEVGSRVNWGTVLTNAPL